MKRLILISITYFLITSFAGAEDLKWYTWDQGYELAKKEHKPMLVFVHASWCHQCQRLDQRVFNDEEIIPLIVKDFIPVKFDIEADEEYTFKGKKMTGKEILEAISKQPVRGIPTTVFWKANGKKVKPVVGLKDPDEMKRILAKNRK